MHNKYLGTDQQQFGSTLYVLCYIVLLNSPQENLLVCWDFIKQHYGFFCKRVVQGFVVLLERCQKLCKRDSFKRVVQKSFFCQRDVKSCAREIISKELCKSVFLPERCPELHKIYCCPDSCAKERFTYFCFF